MEPIEQLVAAIRESAKYRDVSPAAIRRIGQRELANRRNLKEAIKETKNTLHQIAGAYLDAKPRYTEWLGELEASHPPDLLPRKNRGNEEKNHLPSPVLGGGAGGGGFRDACLRMMESHASTRERLPYLAEFYATLFAELPPVHSILDVACGLNPLALPWMNLPEAAVYYACDLYGEMTDFLNRFFALVGRNGRAEQRDVLSEPPVQEVDLALVLKLLPVLEQWEKSAGLRLLRDLKADFVLVSFPKRSLGGRGKGMAGQYEARFRTLLQDEIWPITRYEFETELCFLVQKYTCL